MEYTQLQCTVGNGPAFKKVIVFAEDRHRNTAEQCVGQRGKSSVYTGKGATLDFYVKCKYLVFIP